MPKSYTLQEAFDKVGRKLYQDDWTGNEVFARTMTWPVLIVETDDPSEIPTIADIEEFRRKDAVMARADLPALELMMHLGECYQRKSLTA